MIRKSIAVLIIFIMFFSIHITVYAYNNPSFSDIKNHWSTEYIVLLTEKGIIKGYPDGTFKPDNNVAISEAVKMLIVATGEDVGSSKEGHWATNYMIEAKEKNYITGDELRIWDNPITRGELAKLIIRALNEEYPENINEYARQIKDYKNMDDEFKEYVLKAYVKGIITGYPDGTFKPENNVTRAEASTMLVRFLELDKRKIPELLPYDKDFVEPEFHIEYYTSLDSYDYFGIQLENWEDYKEHSEYYFTTECISHPEINNVNWKGLDGKFSNKVRDMIADSKSNIDGKFNRNFYGHGQIYGLQQFYEWKPSDSNIFFNIKDGEMMKYKITVDNGEKTKEYFLDIEFKNKKFRYNNI